MNKRSRRENLDLILFAGPAFLFVLFVTVIPFIMNLYYSLYKWNGISSDMKFVGLGNFVKIFTRDIHFKTSLLFTFKFTLIFVILVNIFAILIANYLSETNRINSFSRAFFFVPYIISMVAISLIWEFLLGPGMTYIYETTGMEIFGISWLGDPKYAFISVLIVSIWQNLGFYAVIYVAGFSAIPHNILEAAAIDGASRRQRFFKIKLPLLMQAISICSFYALTYGLKLFDVVLVLTKGGPGNSTKTVAYDIYINAFMSDKYGLATAKSLVFFVIVLIFTVVQLRIFKGREVEY